MTALLAPWVSGYVGTDDITEHFQDFTRLGVAPLDRFLGENEVVIDGNLKCAFTTGHNVQAFDNVLVMCKQFVYHANCAVRIVSRDAIF